MKLEGIIRAKANIYRMTVTYESMYSRSFTLLFKEAQSRMVVGRPSECGNELNAVLQQNTVSVQ